MSSVQPLTPERAERLEPQLRARADQLRPRGTPLGVCHVCQTFVFAADGLAMSAGSLLHRDCIESGRAGTR